MSEAGGHAAAFVAAHRDAALRLGARLVALIELPEEFCLALGSGLRELCDPLHVRQLARVSPGVPADLAVRSPLLELVMDTLAPALAEGSSISSLRLAERLISSPHRDLRLFALPGLRRALAEDPELTWQLMRRMGRGALDWIEVDALADVWARGVLAESFRWAELELLVYSERASERRLVGATLATIPSRVPARHRAELRDVAVQRVFPLIAMLMGDAEEMVQKALSWAVRTWARVDEEAAVRLLRSESRVAAESGDGARAWVIRDSLVALPPPAAAELRALLTGLRRQRSAPSTSIAAGQAAGFTALLTAAGATSDRQGQRYTRRSA